MQSLPAHPEKKEKKKKKKKKKYIGKRHVLGQCKKVHAQLSHRMRKNDFFQCGVKILLKQVPCNVEVTSYFGGCSSRTIFGGGCSGSSVVNCLGRELFCTDPRSGSFPYI